MSIDETNEPAVEELQNEATDGQDLDVAVDPEGAEVLGDPGKKALDATKAKWKAERDRRRELERELEEARRPQTVDGDAPDADAIRQQATQEAITRANARIVRAEIRAAAAGKLADPADALAFIDTDTFEVGESGDVDAEEIAEAISDLLARKPHLAAGPTRRFQGGGDGGAGRGSKPQSIDDRIRAAEKDGDLGLSLRLKQQKLIESDKTTK